MAITLNHQRIRRVGVTGTREGGTEAQLMNLRIIFAELWPFDELHHGMCVGVDEQAHRLAREMFGKELTIHGWPPIIETHMAFLWDVDVMHRERDYKARDNEIAYRTQALVALPFEVNEKLRSGTWTTVRRAYAHIRPICLIKPTGDIETEWKPELITGRMTQTERERWGYEWDKLADLFTPPRRKEVLTLEDAFEI